MAMTRAEMEERVDQILLKEARGEKLTKDDWRILQYSEQEHCRCSCGVRR